MEDLTNKTNRNEVNDACGNETDNKRIELLQEYIHVDKAVQETGRVKITKKVVEDSVPQSFTGKAEYVEITRNAINSYVDDDYPSVREEDGETVYAVLKEVLVKRLVLVEEVRVKKVTREETEQLNHVLRHEEIVVEREHNKRD